MMNSDSKLAASGLTENKLRVARYRSWGKRQGVWDRHVHTAVFKTDDKQGRSPYTAQGTLVSVTWQPGWEGSLGKNDTCRCVAEFLCCPLETITVLLIGYTPI